MRTPVLFSFPALMLLAAACGPSAPPEIKAFTAAPETLAYGGGAATLTWDVSEDAKSLRIEPGVGTVTGKAGSVQVSVTTTTAFTLTATNEKGDRTATATVTVATVTNVAGRVVGENGQAAPANTKVFVPGKAPAFTDDTGRFTVAGVTPPYDIAVVSSANAEDVSYYRGVTRADPQVVMWGASPPLALGAQVRGSLAGTFSTAVPGTFRLNEQRIRFESSGTYPGQNATVNNAGTIGGQFNWGSGSTLIGTAHALQWQKNSLTGEATGYFGYARVDNVTLVNGNTYDFGSIALQAVTTASISGLLNPPPNFSGVYATVRLVYGSTSFPIVNNPFPGTAWSYLVPSNVGGAFTVIGTAQDANNPNLLSVRQIAGLAPGASNVNLDIPAPPLPGVPSDGATGVTTATLFDWTSYAATNPIYRVTFTPNAGGDPLYRVITTATSTTIPDLSALTLALPAAATYDWKVEALAPFGHVNEVLAPSAIVGLETRSLSLVTYGADGTDPGPRSFTTAP